VGEGLCCSCLYRGEELHWGNACTLGVLHAAQIEQWQSCGVGSRTLSCSAGLLLWSKVGRGKSAAAPKGTCGCAVMGAGDKDGGVRVMQRRVSQAKLAATTRPAAKRVVRGERGVGGRAASGVSSVCIDRLTMPALRLPDKAPRNNAIPSPASSLGSSRGTRKNSPTYFMR